MNLSPPIRTNHLPPVPEAIRRLADSTDRQLAWQFFVFFSRFEYALKRTGRYLKLGKTNAEADWEKFARIHASEFDAVIDERLEVAVNYFKAEPPRKQLNDAGRMSWSEPGWYDERDPLLKWLLAVVVCRLRNNLFHGGKFPLVAVSEPSRDSDLIAYAITILDAALKLDKSVMGKFYESIED